jgi:hypothetical protein
MPRKFVRAVSFLLFIPLVLICTTFIPQSASAQELTARIQGTVTDPTGAVIPGVEVTATNTATGISQTVTSTGDGNYQFLTLPIGTYKVTATKSGFKLYQVAGITLQVSQIYRLNIRMEVGQVAQQVTVQAAPVQVQTTSMQRGTVITQNQLERIPTLNRNWVQLQQLQPGVVSSSDRFGDNYATNGSQSQQNSYLVNGMDVNDIPLNTPLVLPSPDAIAEFRMVTSTIDPQYSRNSGAILNSVIKSGTNNFHGSAFWYFRDTSLNTRDFFQPSPAVFHRNLFGGTIGGPVWKNHTFFFFSYQGQRAAQPQAGGDVKVFSSAQLAGDFSPGWFADSTSRSPIPLFGDASSNCPVAGGTPCPAGTLYSTLWTTGVIPKEDFNSISQKLIQQYVPPANVGHDYTFTPSQTTKNDQELFRIDHTFNNSDSVWWYSLFQRNPTTSTLPFTGSTLPGFPQENQSHIQEHVFSWTHIFGSTMVNELRAGTTRLNFLAVNPINPTLPSSAGFDITPQNSAAAGLPRIGLTGYFTLGFSNNGPQPRIDQNYQFTDDFSKVVGNHTLKIGWAGRRFNVWNPFYFANNGVFSFGGSGTYSTGDVAADFLLGFPDSYYQSSGGFIDAQAYQNYIYFQDQWKVKPNFTFTYGLGYQIDTPLVDRANGAVSINCFRPGQQSTVYPTAPTGLVFPGDPGCTSSGYSTHYNEFGPRIGFAWSPHLGALSGNSGQFSIRGGFGMYYDRSEEELALQNLLAPPFALIDYGINDVGGTSSFQAPFTDITCIDQNGNALSTPACAASAGTIANKYPFSPPAAGSNVDFSFYEPFSLNIMDPKFRVPTVMNYNLTVEREMPGRIILDIAYVGSESRHNIAVVELNPGLNPEGCATTQTITLGGNTYTCWQLRQYQNYYFPQNFKYDGRVFASLGQQSTVANSNYNGIQVSANKALSHGLTFLASYTYAHSLDTASSYENAYGNSGSGRAYNPFNNAYNYGDSNFDARQRLVFSYTYDLPDWGRGPLHFLTSRVTKGWRIAGITTFQTGFPVSIADSNYTSLTCDAYVYYGCWDNPNVNGAVSNLDPRNNTYNHQFHYGFDPNLFTPAAEGTFGNTTRNFFHGPGLNNWDLEFTKDTQLTESYHLQLRIEFYNLFNHAQFSRPNGNIHSSSFGRITGTSEDPRLIQLAARFVF